MSPKEVLLKWIDAFNEADIQKLSDLYAGEVMRRSFHYALLV